MIQVVNWDELQHYRDRRPLWIKLYRKLLENPKWHALTGDAGKLLAECWLVASEHDDGVIPMDAAGLAWRLRRNDVQRVHVLLQEIVRQGFIVYGDDGATGLLADPDDVGSLEKRREEKSNGASDDAHDGEVGQDPRKRYPKKPKYVDGRYQYPPEFEAAWANYPKRSGSNPKVGAYTAWRACAVRGSSPDHLASAALGYRQEMRQTGREGTVYVQQASTFYGPKATWADYVSTNGTGPPHSDGSGPMTRSETRAFFSAQNEKPDRSPSGD